MAKLFLEPMEGIEPPTKALQVPHSTIELHRRIDESGNCPH